MAHFPEITQIHIICALKPIPEENLKDKFLQTPRIAKIPKMFLTSKKWEANLTSLLTSTFPSHHGIWSSTPERCLGLHTDSIIASFQTAIYDRKKKYEKSTVHLLNQLGFSPGDLSHECKSQKSCISIDLIHSFEQKTWAHIQNEFNAADNFPHRVIILVQLEANTPYDPIPLYISLPKKVRLPQKQKEGFCSVVDIAPTLAKLLKLKLPYTWIGQQMPHSQNSVLYEHTLETTTLITPEYRMTIDKNNPIGEFYHIQSDPDGKRNLWEDEAYLAIKSKILLAFAWAQLGKESIPMPRIAVA